MGYKKQFRLLGGLIFLIVLLELLVFNRQYIVQKFSGLEQRLLHVEDGVLNQMSYENGVLISKSGNSRIKFEHVNMRIMSISITCYSSIATASGQVFYRSDDQPFSALNSVTYQPRRNGSEIILSLPETPFVSDLRIDLSDQKGDIITCEKFVINPYAQIRLSLARLTLYICILALAMVELSKGAQYGNKYLQHGWLSFTKNITRKTGQALNNKGAIILAIVWVLLWLLPWAIWLDALPWLRSGLSLFLFVTPGIVLSLLLVGARFSLPSHVSIGVAFSVLLVGALGFTGRILHWPFEYVKNLFALSGLISMLFLIKYSASKQPLYKPTAFSNRTLILLLFMIVFGIFANARSQHSSDDLSYIAYLTNWQHAQQLGFHDVIYGIGTADSIRFWWGMFPMSLALLAELSHLHGLLLMSIYLEPFLVAVVTLAIYTLYEDFLPSQNQAIAATLIQFTFLFLLRQAYQPGHMFFERPSDDKVFAAFALAPVFFMAVHYFLESPNKRSRSFFLLTGCSLALTHPIILAYSVFIAGVYAVIETVPRKEYTKLGIVTILLVLIIAPSASLRFIDEAWVTRSILGLRPTVEVPDTFSLDAARETSVRTNVDTVISYIEDTPFYGFNLERIQIAPNRITKNPVLVFLSWSYVWILGIGFLWSLFNMKKNTAAPFIAAASLLVLLCAIPYTGWLMGYFVSARMLYRAPWLLPMGLISFTLLREFFNVVKKKLSINGQTTLKINSILYTWMTVACLILVTYFSEFVYQYHGLSTKAQLDRYRNHLTRLVELGYYLDNNIEQPGRFVARPGLMNYLPGLSANSKVVLFRLKEWAPYPIDENELGSLISNEPSISMEQRLNLLAKYQIQYILIDQPSLEKYYSSFPEYFQLQYMDGYWLFKFLYQQEKGKY